MWFTRRAAPVPDERSCFTGLEAMLKRADGLRDEADPAGAAVLYREALALAPDRIEVKVQLGNMLKDTGALAEAEALYREALAVDPEDPDICVQLGHALKLRGDRAGAMAQYRRAAALDPTSRGAVAELAEAGSSPQQRQRFEAQVRAGGVEAVMALARQVDGMRDALDRIGAGLSGALAFSDAARDGEIVPLTLLLLADREPPEGLAQQLAGFADQSHADWRLVATGRDPERERMVADATARDPRVAWRAVAPAEDDGAAEWRAARDVGSGWLVFVAPGSVPEPETLRRLAWTARRTAAQAWRLGEGDGVSFAMAADAFERAAPNPPGGDAAAARARLLADVRHGTALLPVLPPG